MLKETHRYPDCRRWTKMKCNHFGLKYTHFYWKSASSLPWLWIRLAFLHFILFVSYSPLLAHPPHVCTHARKHTEIQTRVFPHAANSFPCKQIQRITWSIRSKHFSEAPKPTGSKRPWFSKFRCTLAKNIRSPVKDYKERRKIGHIIILGERSNKVTPYLAISNRLRW